MESQLSSVISKVQKLLELSKSSNANEAANAAAAANKLIDQFRLSAVDLALDLNFIDPIVEDDSYIYETGRITPWKVTLIDVLTSHYGVAHYNDNHFPEGRKVSRFKLVGRSSDVQIVRYMFAWLSNECQRLADSQVKGQGRIVVASYCNGFVNGIGLQLETSRQEVQQHASQLSIVKLDARLQESEDFMYSKYDTLKVVKRRTYSRKNVSAFMAGQQQGQRVHLGSALTESKIKLLA